MNQQRTLLSAGSAPRYIVNLDALRAMAAEQARIMEIFTNSFNNMRNQQLQNQQMMQQQQQQQQPHQQQPQQHMVNNLMVPPMMGNQDMSQQGRPQRPPSAVGLPQQHQQHPHQPPQQQPPPNLNQPPRPPVSLQPPPIKRKQQPSISGAASTPSPAPLPSASTPVPSAQTPTPAASSPPSNTKSPKNKSKPKPTPTTKNRRFSKVVQPTIPLSQSGPNSGAESSQHSAAANGKRPRESDSATPNGGAHPDTTIDLTNEPSPPKKIKTEWESQPSEAQRAKSEAQSQVKTEEEGSAFLEQMTELIKLAAAEDQGTQESLTSDISETLDMILKNYGSVPDVGDGIGGMPMAGPSSGAREPTPPPAPPVDAFDEFFDFSFGTVEDEDSNSKAPTPDLISSSSTNPSPESNHEAEAGHHLLTSTSSSTMDARTEETSDHLRLGAWKEIDGGEAAYYQTTEWKWDSPMPTDQPWAIFNS